MNNSKSVKFNNTFLKAISIVVIGAFLFNMAFVDLAWAKANFCLRVTAAGEETKLQEKILKSIPHSSPIKMNEVSDIEEVEFNRAITFIDIDKKLVEEEIFGKIKYALEQVKEEIYKNILSGYGLRGAEREKITLDWREGTERVIFEIMPGRANKELCIKRYYGGFRGLLNIFPFQSKYYALKGTDGIPLEKIFQKGETVALKDLQVITQRWKHKKISLSSTPFTQFIIDYFDKDRRFAAEFAKRGDVHTHIISKILLFFGLPLEAGGSVVETLDGDIENVNKYVKAITINGDGIELSVRGGWRFGMNKSIFNYHSHPYKQVKKEEATIADIIESIINRGDSSKCRESFNWRYY